MIITTTLKNFVDWVDNSTWGLDINDFKSEDDGIDFIKLSI